MKINRRLIGVLMLAVVVGFAEAAIWTAHSSISTKFGGTAFVATFGLLFSAIIVWVK